MTMTAQNSYPAREYWEQRLTQKWGLHGVGHISYGKPYNTWLYRVRRRVFLRALASLSLRAEESVVLDIGSGTGFWLDVWKSLRVRELVGSDMTSVAVNSLRNSYPDCLIRQLDISDPAAISDIKEKFNFITAFDVLYHIMEEKRFQSAISNISALLSPGGHFLFSDTFLRTRQTGSAHQVNRTLEEYSRLLNANGLEVLQRAPVFVLMSQPADLRSTIPGFLWRLAMAPVKVVPILGHVYGAGLYGPEILLTRYLKESPTTEILICRKAERKAS